MTLTFLGKMATVLMIISILNGKIEAVSAGDKQDVGSLIPKNLPVTRTKSTYRVPHETNKSLKEDQQEKLPPVIKEKADNTEKKIVSFQHVGRPDVAGPYSSKDLEDLLANKG